MIPLFTCSLMFGGCRSEGDRPESASQIEAPDGSSSSISSNAPTSRRASEATTDSPPPRERQGVVSNDLNYFVAYAPQPAPITLNEMFGLSVWVYSAKDHSQPLFDVQVSADAAMPEHDHGMNTVPKVAANADGSFTVKGMLFHMPGRWEVYLDVSRGGVTERAQFDVRLE